ncbi:MAG: cytochrome ubiquinol oxidase subunit I [Prevotella sp.]|jgi:cytochrome d ubiquinol oxidase subunit I|nr:cytochrome ubiquinol oxidase subunit I [Prevotella sp.]
MEFLNASLIDWSRLQFAVTAAYHWLFVPLTLGLGVIMSIMETMYVRTGNEQWKQTAKFWMNIFGINFAIGVATGLIMEFQFGTNWSNYSWFVGDIFGAPLAIEAIVAFFMEATFISIMFFGWKRVGKKMHLAATWLTIIGATISAWWILVANAWMQHPVGMEFNPDSARNEMVDFFAVALSPVAVAKFFHTVLSSWILGSVVVLGISSWYLLKQKNVDFARQSIKIAAVFGLAASLLTAITGHTVSYYVAQTQPMKLAAMEGLYRGEEGAGLIAVALPNPAKESYKDSIDPYIFKIEIPKALSLLGYNSLDAFVPGITDIIEGGYDTENGKALSFAEKQERGKWAIAALKEYKQAVKTQDDAGIEASKAKLKEYFACFGYGYLETPEQLIPNIPLTFWSFHVMVYLGCFFILLFALVIFFERKKSLDGKKWLLWTAVWSIPPAYLAGQLGWIVAEVGRQPWAIQDVLPVQAAISALSAGSVITTFFLFLALFTALLVAEIRIMLNQIKKGPEDN